MAIAPAWLPASPVWAEKPEYQYGYVDALLDSRFPGYGLSVQAIEPDRSVRVASRTCLAPTQRRDIERLLAKTGRVRAVVWDASATCDDPAPSPEGAAQIELRLLPEDELYAPYLADPRQARFSMSVQRYDTPNDTFNAASVAFGEYFPLASGVIRGIGASQIGIQGAVFALFNLDAPSSDLVNADYCGGTPTLCRSAATNGLSGRLQIQLRAAAIIENHMNFIIDPAPTVFDGPTNNPPLDAIVPIQSRRVNNGSACRSVTGTAHVPTGCGSSTRARILATNSCSAIPASIV